MLRSQLKLKHPSQHRAGGAARRRNALQADIAPRAPVLCIKSTPSPTNTGASRYEIDSNLSVRALRSNLESAPSAQPLRTYYLYAEEGLIAESTQAISLNTDGSVTAGAAPQITTQYGPRPDSDFTTGVLFVKTNNSNNQPSVAYLHHDHLQTPLQATDKAGNVVWAASYNAFGKASVTTPAATADKPTIPLNLRLPGQYLDEETGLHYNWHRYYDADTGRYVTADPIGLRGGMNQYAYAAGAPITYTDPEGLQVLVPLPPFPIPGVSNPSLDAQRALIERIGRSQRSDDETTYQTYTRYNPTTGECYSGRTSGTADPLTNIKKRSYGQPLLNAEGFQDPVLDRSSSSKNATRGREQQLIELNGGARSSGGNSRNMINGIRPSNPLRPIYLYLATDQFGPPVSADRCTCQKP